MKQIIDNNIKKVNSKEINSFLEEFHLNPPISFIHFLLKYNGGLLENNDKIKRFLSIKYGGLNIEDMINMHQIIEQNIPKGYLPIALDWSDNPITINTNEGHQKGEIVKFYFDTDEEPEVIAHSLEELLGVTSMDEL